MTATATSLSETSPSNGDRFKFAGMEWDAAIGQYYDHARDYDAAAGRFMSQDPLGFAGGDTNLGIYVGNGPTLQVDPTGLQPLLQRLKAGGTRGRAEGTRHRVPLSVRGRPAQYRLDAGPVEFLRPGAPWISHPPSPAQTGPDKQARRPAPSLLSGS